MNTRPIRVTTRLLERTSRDLKRHLPSAVSGDDHGVHQARVASRRLRETVPVLATGLKGSKAGKARRKIRRLTRALGTVRELDVTLGLLDELARMDDVPRSAVEAVRAGVIAERDSGRESMLKRLNRVNVDKLHRRLASVAKALEASKDEGWREALGGRLVKRSGLLSEAIDAAGQMYAPERLHQVRIAAKKLRYGLEIASGIGTKSAAPLVRALKRVQDLLGQLHDLQVLLAHVAEVHAALTPGTGVTPHGLEALSRRIEGDCRHLHGRYVAASGALAGVPLRVTAVVLPELAHPARRRPLKMALPHRAASTASGRR
jgi:CHAD domain-containing protein